MIAVTSPVLWYFSRAAGIVALALLTASMFLGLTTSARVATSRWPRFAISDLHRRVSLVAMTFVGLHVLSTVIDTFVPIGVLAAVVPFTSHYRPLWVGLGAVAFDLMLAVMITSLLRNQLKAATWRAVHWLVYASWPVAVLHALMVGTDARSAWLLAIVAACCAVVIAAVCWRVLSKPRLPDSSRDRSPVTPASGIAGAGSRTSVHTEPVRR
jgi:methionine sulfoxide reductase heme-binding subunit